MIVDKKILQNCKGALDFFNCSESDKYVCLQSNENYIDYWIEKYHMGDIVKYKYWDSNRLLFEFSSDIFDS